MNNTWVSRVALGGAWVHRARARVQRASGLVAGGGRIAVVSFSRAVSRVQRSRAKLWRWFGRQLVALRVWREGVDAFLRGLLKRAWSGSLPNRGRIGK